MINYIKRQFKKILIALGILGVALAAPIIIPDKPLDISQEKVVEKFANANFKEHYKLQGAKFIKEAPNENEIRIEVGGVSEFEPALRLSRWDNEVHFKIKPNLQGIPKKNRKLDLEGNKIKLDVGKKEYHFYEEGDNFKFIPVFKEKPTTNIVSLSIETNGLDFFYQPELTQEEIDDGAFRPENVVGSYAVYHSTKQGDYSQMGLKNYRAGKAFHIYRPRLKDSNGWEVWGDLFIDAENGIYRITIPTDFYENAVYPIRSNDTFGYDTESHGGSSNSFTNMLGGSYFMGAAGTATGMSAYFNHNNKKVQTALYLHSDLSQFAVTTERAGTFGTQYWDFTFSSPPIISAVNYYLILFSEGIGNFAYDDVGDNLGYLDWATYSNWPDPLDGGVYDRRYSIYCTYTAGGADRRIIITD